jgi:hypothetical protein
MGYNRCPTNGWAENWVITAFIGASFLFVTVLLLLKSDGYQLGFGLQVRVAMVDDVALLILEDEVAQANNRGFSFTP